jgi:hypothetical protein
MGEVLLCYKLKNTRVMAKTILIPTDFSSESLHLIKGAISENEGDKLNVILLYAANNSNSITDLLFFNKKRSIEDAKSEQFQEGCDIILNKYSSSINSFRTELFTGFTQNAFENFVDANQIDEAYIPKNYEFKLNKNMFNPIPFIKKSALSVSEIEWEQELNDNTDQERSELQFNYRLK